MTDHAENPKKPADDMSEYLQTFLDETEEQLDDLVETLLALEKNPANADDLNEAFRLVHSIKGSAGMMGFDNVAVLTHHLENRFDRFRSGTERLDEATMNLVLRCIDFLRQCNARLRDGEQLPSSTQLLNELKRLEDQAITDEPVPSQTSSATVEEAANIDSSAPQSLDDEEADETAMVVRFRTGLQLADLKAQLILARLSDLGDVKSTQPDVEQLADSGTLAEFTIRLETDAGMDALRAAADVDGVEAIEFARAAKSSDFAADDEVTTQHVALPAPANLERDDDAALRSSLDESIADEADPPDPKPRDDSPAAARSEATIEAAEEIANASSQADSLQPVGTERSTAKVAETMRVDIDRLDNLMNLAGELVVNRARFVQISGQLSPHLRKASMLDRIRDFSESLRRTIENLESAGEDKDVRSAQIQQLRSGLDLMDEQSEVWDNGRQFFDQIGEAIDQLSRVSHSLQRGVLDTRMVPVGPLFNRFKRVVRDLSTQRGKKVNLLIHGEKTELDKRMIDELGDPLVHLVRNSIDHGLEPPEIRAGCGKPEIGTIYLEASHSGNNVYIHVRDDGGGIDVDKIKAKLIDKQFLDASTVDELSDDQALEYIWHPGFSTASEVTDVSGRGVGMDVVKTRIGLLNGTIEVNSSPQQGTTFSLRLPLTLAIIDCLLVRLRSAILTMPIDDVREIVSLKESDVVTVHGRQTFEVRGEFLPLVSIDDVFHWHDIDYGYQRGEDALRPDFESQTVEVVVLHAGGKTMGLRVDELLGSQDVVIKSLSENFINIRGLSGASILGDGSVCLMLDVGTLIHMATQPLRTMEIEEGAT